MDVAGVAVLGLGVLGGLLCMMSGAVVAAAAALVLTDLLLRLQGPDLWLPASGARR